MGIEAGKVSREDAVAALGARAELGRELEDEVVDAFVERVEQAIDTRVDERLAERDRSRRIDPTTVVVALGSMLLGLPITAVAAGAGGVAVVAVWIGIVAINVAHARHPPRVEAQVPTRGR